MTGHNLNLPHFDSPDAVAQRAIFHEAAGHKSSYDVTLELLLPHLPHDAEGAITPDAVIDDWGCNSPDLILRALTRAGLHLKVRGFDIMDEKEITAGLPDSFDLSNFTYYRVDPASRTSPVAPNTADAAVFNNVVFRAQDQSPRGAEDLIRKGMYGVKLGGVAVLGSNYNDHAGARHWLAWIAQMRASRECRVPTTPLRPPAHSMPVPELIDLLKGFPDLEILDILQDNDDYVKVPSRDALLKAVATEVLRTDLSPAAHVEYLRGAEIYAARLMKSAERMGKSGQDISHTAKVLVRKTDIIEPFAD